MHDLEVTLWELSELKRELLRRAANAAVAVIELKETLLKQGTAEQPIPPVSAP
jgi:hypothetical protein